MDATEIIDESLRYYYNAKEILSEHGKKHDGFYHDIKYVRIAGDTAYKGVLYALDGLFKTKGVKYPAQKVKNRDRVDADFYREQLGKMNKKMLKFYNTAYNLLHLTMGYDGELNVNIANQGLYFAIEIIKWVAIQVNYKNKAIV